MARGDDLTDEQFLRLCRVEAMRGPGPGGQKRNKTSSYIRITHELTRFTGVAGESRSQSRNRATALTRLRVKLAIQFREPIDVKAFSIPTWFAERTTGSQTIGPQSAEFGRAVALVLDVLAANEYALAPTREMLNLSSRQLTGMLCDDAGVLQAVQWARADRGLHPLKPLQP